MLPDKNSKFLLLSCCAPCSCAVIKTLAEQFYDFSVVFYNPNVRPQQEYCKRCEENRRICSLYQIPFVELEYDNEHWCEMTKGLENEPERGARCSVCFYMRLKRVMEYAKANGFSGVASVLGVSRYKNLEQVNASAAKASAEKSAALVCDDKQEAQLGELMTHVEKAYIRTKEKSADTKADNTTEGGYAF